MTTMSIKAFEEAMDRMDLALNDIREARAFYQVGREVIAAVGAMVAVVPQATACMCSGKGTCATCLVWRSYAQFENAMVKASKPLDSPPAVG